MNKRLLSIDIFRGMTIFFMIVVNTPGSWDYVYAPLRHAKWDGLTPTDLVFPFFLFIVGVSLFLSNQNGFKQGVIYVRKKAITRGLTIVLLGLLLNWYPFFTKSLDQLRIFGVLQRIGISFLCTSLLVTIIPKKRVWWLVMVLLFTYCLMILSVGEGALTLEGNLVRKVDLWLLGENHVYKGYGIPFDPEGLLSTIPSVVTVLLGYITGAMLTEYPDKTQLIKALIKTGTLLTIFSLILDQTIIPINKPIWSASYVLITAGFAMFLLSLLIWIIDIRKWITLFGKNEHFNPLSRWAELFHVFGVNPLVSYILSGLFVKTALLIKISDKNLYQWTFSQVYQPCLGDYFGSLVFAISYALFIWIFAYILYRKEIIIKA